MKAYNGLNTRTCELYHVITGPVLACWHVIKDCASRVANEQPYDSAAGTHCSTSTALLRAECLGMDVDSARGDQDEADKPDTTLSIVRAELVDGRRLIGLRIDDKHLVHVCSELKRQNRNGWQDYQSQDAV